jgi:hypothetical protein
MKTKILIGILVFLIIVNLATIGTFLYLKFARPGPDGLAMPGDGGRPPGRAFRDPMAHLSADQRNKLNELMRGFHDESRALNDKVRDLEETTFRLLHESTIPNDSIDLTLRQMADLRLEISRKATQRLIAAKAFLDPAQQDILFDAIMKARPEFGGGPPPGGEGMPPPPMRFGPPSGRGRPPGPERDARP